MEGRHFLQASTILEFAGILDLVPSTPVSHVLKTYETVMSFRMVVLAFFVTRKILERHWQKNFLSNAGF